MRKAFHSINGRVLLIPVVALAALILAGAASVRTIADITLVEHQARARAVAQAASKIVEAYEAKAAKGEMTDDQAQEAAKVALRAIRYDGSEYVMARRQDGVITINGLFPDREGSKSYDNKDSAGSYFSRDMIEQAEHGGGFNYYFWPKQPNTPPLRKATYSLLTPRWKWVVGSGVYLDEVDQATWNNALNTVGIVAAVALLTFAIAFWLGRRIAGPIVRLTEATHRLADGDLAVAIPGAERRDEVGTMAQAVAVLKERSAEATRLAAEQDRLKAETAAERQRAMRELAGGFEASFKTVIDGIAPPRWRPRPRPCQRSPRPPAARHRKPTPRPSRPAPMSAPWPPPPRRWRPRSARSAARCRTPRAWRAARSTRRGPPTSGSANCRRPRAASAMWSN
jgi:methyl-accepting chemotaxis protein